MANIFEEEHAARCARGRVVVIDDDRAIVAALSALLEMEGYACETHASAEAYLHVLSYNSPSFPGPFCVLCDMKMPGMNGLELQSRLAALHHAPLLFMSGGSGITMRQCTVFAVAPWIFWSNRSRLIGCWLRWPVHWMSVASASNSSTGGPNSGCGSPP